MRKSNMTFVAILSIGIILILIGSFLKLSGIEANYIIGIGLLLEVISLVGFVIINRSKIVSLFK